MFITHTNSVYSEKLTLLDHVPYPQYVHQINNGGGIAVRQGVKLMPAELIDYVLKGKHSAEPGTLKFIRSMTELSSCKIGFILAAGSGNWLGYSSNIERTPEYPEYKIPLLGSTQVRAGYTANRIGSFDYIITDSTSCISGHSAWFTAWHMITLGTLDAVVVIAVDNSLSEDYLTIFGENGLSKLLNEEKDPTVNKFRLGQGCNITVFESEDCSTNTKHVPLAISDTGIGYKKVINGVKTTGIDFIKTHSTFSDDNQIEEVLIKQKFGDIRTVNYKLRVGHTMGASTAIETALAIQEESGKFLSLGAGMGNVFSSDVVEIL